LRTAQRVPALAIVFVSIVVVTGYTGQLSLGQAGFAGLGALVSAKIAGGSLPWLGRRVPPLAALDLAVAAVAVLGFVIAWPAIRRRGLYLALATFAIAAVASRFVFNQPAFTALVHVRALTPFTGARAFYLFELACLGLALAVVRNHHSGRLGRALQAVRDDERGAQACGVDVRRLRVWAFAVSAGLAALGGALLSISQRAFDAADFDPIVGLIWFAAVVVFGVDSATSAILGAALMVALDSVRADVSTLVVGLGAVTVGFLPGGLLYSGRRALQSLWNLSARPEVELGPPRRLSAVGRALAQRASS
jgi:branched-chain amino acid transport system permease protein